MRGSWQHQMCLLNAYVCVSVFADIGARWSAWTNCVSHARLTHPRERRYTGCAKWEFGLLVVNDQMHQKLHPNHKHHSDSAIWNYICIFIGKVTCRFGWNTPLGQSLRNGRRTVRLYDQKNNCTGSRWALGALKNIIKYCITFFQTMQYLLQLYL